MNPDISRFKKLSSNETMVLLSIRIPQNLYMSLTAMVYLSEGLSLSPLLTLEVANSIICHVGTRIPKVKSQFIFSLETLIISTASRCSRLE